MKQYEPIGKYIHLTDTRNIDLSVTNLVGLTIEKRYIPSVANVIGTDLSKYKVIKQGQFACSLMQVSRDGKMPVAMYKGEPAIMSPAYPVFEVNDINELMPEYLHMYLSRQEFDREAVFRAVGGVRGSLDWEDFLAMKMPVPDIDEQRKIVAEYQAVEQRIENNNRLIKALEDTAQAIYHHTFVENIDPENLPEGWYMGKLSDIAEYSKERVDTCELDNSSYISTENMLKDKGGVTEANKVPEGKCVKFRTGDILLSNIRPYFKKVWQSTFCGGCSTDVLCIKTKEDYPPEYTYQIIESDSFFDYVTAGCKGTKMPRGDKEWNMNYDIPIPSSLVLNVFRNKATMIRNQIEQLRKENSCLEKAKNLLLSKLS